MQHDVFSWEVGRDDVIRMREISQGSAFMSRTLRDWLSGLDREQLRRFTDALYAILLSAETDTLPKLGSDWLKSASLMLRTYQGIDGASKKIIAQTISAFFKAARNNINLLLPPKGGPKGDQKAEAKTEAH
jgi:hypothetical protein